MRVGPGRLCLLLGMLGVLAWAPSRAEVAFVTDSLMLGLHADASLSSAIVRLVPSGTELELIEQRDDLARVRLGDGTDGWVDASYLSAIEPAGRRVRALASELEALGARLSEQAVELDTLRGQSAELERLRAQTAELEALRERAAALDALRVKHETLRSERDDLIAAARTTQASLDALTARGETDRAARQESLARVSELEADGERLRAEISRAHERTAATAAEADEARRDFNARLETAEQHIATLEAELSGATRAVQVAEAAAQAADRVRRETPIASDTLRGMQSLAQRNTELRAEVAELRSALESARDAPPVEPAPGRGRLEEALARLAIPGAVSGLDSVLRLEAWHWLLIGSALLLAFGLGAALTDWSARRRHGGFRV